MNAYVLNEIGLLLDIWGFILLYKYGLVSDLIKAIKKENYPEEKGANKLFSLLKNRSKIGFVLILLGFFFQFLSVFLSVFLNQFF